MCQDKRVSAVWNKCDVFHYLGLVHFFPIEDKNEKRLFLYVYFKHRTADKVKLASNSNCHIPLPESYKIKKKSVSCVT